MKKVLITIAAMAAFGAAMPANAQYGGRDGRGPDRSSQYDNRIDNLEAQIQRGVQRGAINNREAQSLRGDVRQLERLERDYSRGGFTRSERDKLDRRIDNLRDKVERAMRDGRGRDGRRY